MKKKLAKNFVDSKSCRNFAAQKGNGAMSEWLGKGLQNLLHQFESGWHLPKKIASDCVVNCAIFFLHIISGAQFTAQNFGRRILVAVFFTAACFAKLIRPLKGEKWMLFLAEPVIQQVHKLIILQSPFGRNHQFGRCLCHKAFYDDMLRHALHYFGA